MENKSNRWLPISIVVALIILIGGLVWWQSSRGSGKEIKIGVVTDLTGPAAYWGASTRVGAEMAQKDLKTQGYNVNLTFEDYQLDAAKALTAAQKLVNVDGVSGIYAEFNPATYSISPFLKGKNTLFVYDAAPTSPLADLPYAYKSYLDFDAGCKDLAQKYKNQGIAKMGFLKLNWEAGELCLAGVKKVYPDNALVTETFNFGDADVKTQVAKIKAGGAQALMNVSLEADTLTVLKGMKDTGFNVPYGTVSDGVANAVTAAYPEKMKDISVFNFKDVTSDFSAKIEAAAGKKLPIEQGAAIAYIHIEQMVKALDKSNGDMAQVTKKMNESKADPIIGFNGFTDRVASFDMIIK